MKGGLGFGEFRFDTPQLAAGSFIQSNVRYSFQPVCLVNEKEA